MAHAVVFSDIHLDNWDAFHRIDPNTGLNSRMLDGIAILEQIRDYCVKHKIHIVLFCGDMFHKSSHLFPDLLEKWTEIIYDMTTKDIAIYALTGQHDHFAQDGLVNTLAPFRHLVTVMDTVGAYDATAFSIIACPYRRNIENLKENLARASEMDGGQRKVIFMGHFLVKELLKADGVNYDTTNVEFADLPQGYNLYLMGDYHPHVYLPELKLVSVGATNHHTFGTYNRPQGGFLDLDLETMRFERIETKAPMFIKLESGDGFPGEYDRKNFYSIPVHDNDEQDRIKARLKGDWNVVFPGILTEEEEVEFGTETNISVTMEPEEVIHRYIEHFGLSEEYLLKGLEFIQA